MPKGRRFVPTGNCDGIWFPHIGLPNNIENRSTGTTTGILMNDRFNEKAQSLTTVRCPPNYFKRQQGLGKKKATDKTSQHRSDDILTWRKERSKTEIIDLNSLYREDFQGDRCSTAPRHRRYSKIYPTPKIGSIDLNTNTTTWVDDRADVPSTYLQTLANSQEPYLPPNPWKYSYYAPSLASKQRAKKQHEAKIMTVK